LGQLFCDGSARQIVAMLLAECPERVELICNSDVTAVAKAGAEFAVMASGVAAGESL
jgi:predicted flavoprotein YhiN